ncbi:MAG: hypothetical protein EOM25_01345 [Deltaproteobacteria bacterium]|nr:hypothetical protein [Deltaproteobacteria bacterium]
MEEGKADAEFRLDVEPGWMQTLESRWIDDAGFSRAYGLLTTTQRATIKTGIAWLWRFWKVKNQPPGQVITPWPDGTRSIETRTTAPWLLVLLHPDARAPMMLLSAVVPAILAGVQTIAVVRRRNRRRFPPTLLAALELGGVELAADCTSREFECLVRGLANESSAGRTILLGPWESGFRTRAPLWSCPSWQEPEGLGVPDNLERHRDLETLAFAQSGCTTLAEAHSSDHRNREGTVFLSDSAPILGPGCEGLWCWPELGPKWFQNRTLSIVCDHEDTQP